MKYLSALVLTVVLFVGSVFGQGPDLKDYTVVAASNTAALLVDNKNVKRDGGIVTFTALLAAATKDEDSVSLDPNNHMFIVFRVSCSTSKAVVLSRKGAVGGKAFSTPYKVPQASPYDADGPIGAVVNLVCKTHVGTYV